MFNFFIPNGVIAEMGLTTDGQTVSKQVRISDLVADGTLSVSDYHMLALAGVVVTEKSMFTFHSVEETDDGWKCAHYEPEPQAWKHTKVFLKRLFPGGTGTGFYQLWLPEPPTRGFFYRAILVKTQDVLRERGYCGFNGRRIYSFSEGTVTLEENELNSEWVELNLYQDLDTRCRRSYLAQGGRYKVLPHYLQSFE
ncbi:MAG: hypothetical protein B7C55_08050 [Actinomycetales bacterium mxb001]|nr:MAG: hypothetical protein B7C55_08050 [Actinomycetales bacterium mxb001]